jgi:hypothetical protein
MEMLKQKLKSTGGSVKTNEHNLQGGSLKYKVQEVYKDGSRKDRKEKQPVVRKIWRNRTC